MIARMLALGELFPTSARESKGGRKVSSSARHMNKLLCGLLSGLLRRGPGALGSWLAVSVAWAFDE